MSVFSELFMIRVGLFVLVHLNADVRVRHHPAPIIEHVTC